MDFPQQQQRILDLGSKLGGLGGGEDPSTEIGVEMSLVIQLSTQIIGNTPD